MTGLSVIIITLNEEANILRTLQSVKPVADEIIVVDSHSSDRTAEICTEFGCRVIKRVFDGYGPQKQFAADQAVNDWVMYLDADEVVTPELQTELISVFREGQARPGYDLSEITGMKVRSALSYMGRIMRYGGLGREYHLRLYNRKKGAFTMVPVHEWIKVEGRVETLENCVIHYSFQNLTQQIGKINHYASLAAEGYDAKGRRFPMIWVALKFPVTFCLTYFVRLGFLDGYPGFVWALLTAFYASLKVAKTLEIQGRS